MQLHLRLVLQCNRLLHVRTTDCHIVTFCELIVAVAMRNARLADTTIAQQDHLSLYALDLLPLSFLSLLLLLLNCSNSQHRVTLSLGL